MGVGKYSPNCPHANTDYNFKYNCYGKEPIEWNNSVKDSGISFDEKTMFYQYDDEGFDSYGYSAFDINGNYVGVNCGVDRNGMTENDYRDQHVQDWYYP